MIFIEEEFDLLDAFIGEGQDPVVIDGPVHPDDAVLGLETEGQVLDERFADAEVPGDTFDRWAGWAAMRARISASQA